MCMDNEYLHKVIALAHVTAPAERPSSDDWVRAERDIGLSLPGDYRELVTELGTGRFGELSLFNPAHPPST